MPDVQQHGRINGHEFWPAPGLRLSRSDSVPLPTQWDTTQWNIIAAAEKLGAHSLAEQVRRDTNWNARPESLPHTVRNHRAPSGNRARQILVRGISYTAATIGAWALINSSPKLSQAADTLWRSFESLG